MGRGAGGFCTSPKGAGGICTTSRRCRYNFGMSRLQDAAAAAPTPAVPAVPAAVIAPWIGGSSGSTRHICLPVSWGTGKQQLCCHLVHQLWVPAARSFAAAAAAAATLICYQLHVQSIHYAQLLLQSSKNCVNYLSSFAAAAFAAFLLLLLLPLLYRHHRCPGVGHGCIRYKLNEQEKRQK